jgi:hypothetical protein
LVGFWTVGNGHTLAGQNSKTRGTFVMSQMCVTARRKAGVTARSYTTRLVTEQSFHTHEKECKFIIHDCVNSRCVLHIYGSLKLHILTSRIFLKRMCVHHDPRGPPHCALDARDPSFVKIGRRRGVQVANKCTIRWNENNKNLRRALCAEMTRRRTPSARRALQASGSVPAA